MSTLALYEGELSGNSYYTLSAAMTSDSGL